MRIAQVAPLYEPVPPTRYGGTERVVSYLTEELVRRGHEVTLFASGDSVTRARLVAVLERAVRHDAGNREAMAVAHTQELAMVLARAREFDVIHCHVDHPAFPLSRLSPTPVLHTLHGRLDLPYLAPLFRELRDVPFVSISDAQRAPLAGLAVRWAGTVHHGVPLDLYPFSDAPGGYLAFLGRLSPEKRPDPAFEIARRVGLPLKIAAKADPIDHAYFEAEIRPQLDDPLVEYLGEVGDADKSAFLAGAVALLFPIDWPEPFGLAMIEAALTKVQAQQDSAHGETAELPHIARDLRYWQARRASAQVIEPIVNPDHVQFGTTVTILRDGKTKSFKIVGEDEADPAKGTLSYVAPLARALMGKEVGDVAKVGDGEAEIIEIR